MRAAASEPLPRVPDRELPAYLYVALGLCAGIGYALLNTQTDVWAVGTIGRAFGAFHAFVDRGIPVLAGALVGLAFHWGKLRDRLARAEAARADELRSRLRHVERDQAVWVVAAAALHELKNPLHVLGLLVDELGEAAAERDAEATASLAARIRVQMDRTLVPLAALRELAQPGRGSRKERPVWETAFEVVEAMQPIAAEAGVALRLTGRRDGAARASGEYLRIVLDNLLANALEGREASARAQNVLVSVAEDDARVRITVSDDGPGLDAERRRALFEPLRTEKSRGLGLGLPIARALARTMGGELETTEVPGFATSFVLDLPRSAP